MKNPVKTAMRCRVGAEFAQAVVRGWRRGESGGEGEGEGGDGAPEVAAAAENGAVAGDVPGHLAATQ